MIKSEITKIYKTRFFILPLFFIMGYLIYSMINNAEFGYDYADNLFIVVNENGKEYYGQDAYEENKKIANKYTGEINDQLLNEIHETYIESEYGDYNSTYLFFNKIFKISNSNFLLKKDVWGDMVINYGFTGDCAEAITVDGTLQDLYLYLYNGES